MKDTEYNEFVDLMNKLSKNFKNFSTGDKEGDTEKINLYFDNLKKYKLIAVKRGIDYLISTRTYNDFPIIGHITEAIKDSRYDNLVDYTKEKL